MLDHSRAYLKPDDQADLGLITGWTALASLVAPVVARRGGSEGPAALQGTSGPPESNQVRSGRALGDWVLGLEPGYLPSAMTPMPSVLSVRRCLMAW